jgi:hypothetical protein
VTQKKNKLLVVAILTRHMLGVPTSQIETKVHFFYSWHFNYALEMSFSNKKSRQIGFCPQKLAIQSIV